MFLLGKGEFFLAFVEESRGLLGNATGVNSDRGTQTLLLNDIIVMIWSWTDIQAAFLRAAVRVCIGFSTFQAVDQNFDKVASSLK